MPEKTININLEEKPKKKKNWKGKIVLWCFLLIAGFTLGHSYHLKIFKDTFLDKKKKIAKIEADNYNLQKKLDSLESLSLEQRKEVEVFGDAFYYFEDNNKKYLISK